MKHTNSFAIVNLRAWFIAALFHGLAAVACVQSPAFAAEAAPAVPAAEAPEPAAEAPAPVAEAPKPAAEAPAPAAEAPKPAVEAPAPAAEAPKPAAAPVAEASKPAPEAPAPAAEPAAEAPAAAAEAPKPAAETPPAAEAPPSTAEVPKPVIEAPAPADRPSKRAAEARRSAADAPTAEPAATPAEKQLRFTFRYQRWSDVLEWFAEQADLSLVLDAPPPGTFNYSDNRDYSTSEALDLLNSVLLTKGYTLIRRDRMLTLIDLSGDFPEGLIPKVTLDEVEKRGKHELVTVEFSMGRRDPEAVATAVTPLLGPYHKLLPVAPTKQLFVTDRAGVMGDVQKVVQSLPEPRDPPPAPVPPKPEPKELKVYPIDKIDSETLMSLLKELVSGAQLILDPNLSQLHANATAAQHAQIQAVMDQVTAAATSATDRERRVELYDLDQPVTTAAATTKLTDMFKALAPKAVVSLKEDGTAVIAWASPAEHETIRATMDKLGGGPVGDPVKTPQLEIYRLTRVDPTKLITMLEKLVPDAKLSYDERSRSLFALAKPADQQAIRATLLQVQTESETPGADPPRFETYEVRAAETAAGGDAMTAQVQPLVPEAKITYDAKAKRLVVYGTTAEQQLVKSALEKLGLERAAGDTNTIETYPLAGADLTATQTLLAQLIPLAEFTADATQQRLIAVASPADHERIKSTLEKLQPNPAHPQAAQLKFYPFEQEPPADVLELLAKVAPQAKITVDKERERLIVLAPPTSQAAVETAFQQFQQATPAAKPELATYPIQASDPASLLTMLTTRYPKAQIALDTPNKRLLVWASSEDQAAVAAAIEKLEAEPAADQQPRFESYPLFGFATAAEAGTLVTSLQSLVPNARFTIDSKVKNLIVWATEKEHQTVAGALERLSQGPAPQNTPQLEVHRLVKVDADTTLALLQKLAPDAQLTLDAKSSSLIALAVPADQQLIRATLQQLQPGAGGDDAPAVRFHPLANAPSEGLLNILKEMVPTAQLTPDAENKRLIAVATTADHEAIQKIVEQFESSTPPEEPRKLAVYPVTAAQKKRFEAVLPTLQTDMPGLQVLTDDDPGSLTVWARPSEQLKIGELIRQLERDVPQTEQLQLVTYTCAVADPTTISTFLTSLFPDAKFVVDAKSRRILVWARPQDHEKIKPALEQLGSGTAGDFELEFQSYPLSKVAPEIAVPMLQEQLPEAKVLADAKSGRVLAWASKADQAVIAKAIEQLQAGADDQNKPQLVVYPRGDADPQTLVLMLTSLVPTARVAVDAQTGGLAAWATPEDQETIRKAIEEMSKEEVTAGKPSTKAYALKNITATAALPVLTAAVPTAKLSAGADDSQLVAVAQPRDQQMVQSILAEIDVEGAAAAKSSVAVYRLENKSSSTAVLYALSVFRSAFPKANFTLGADVGEFVAWASVKDHEGIQTLVDRLNAPPAPENAPKVALYPLQTITAASALAVLQAAVPRATFTADPADPQRLTASARPSEHEIIKTILAEIDVEGDPGSQPSVVVYQLERQTSVTSMSYAISLLTQAFPRARLLLGTELGQFVAWASAKDHEGIKALIDRLNAGPPPEEAPEATVYSLQHITAASAVSLLTTAVPKATLTPDTEDPRRLTAFASPADHAAIKQILEKIDVAGEPGGGATVAIYELEGATAASSLYYTLTVFRTAFPKATFSVGTEANQFVAWATEKDHTGIKSLVEQMNAAPPPEDAPQVALYTLEWITAASATTVLQAAVPKATITADPADPQRLTALARPADHEKITAVLATIDVEGGGGGRELVAVYQLERQASTTTMSYAISLLTQAFPRARFLLGTEVDQFVAWATAKDQEAIKALVDRLNAGPPPEEAPQATVYSLQHITATTALSLLTTAVPKAKLTPDAEDTRRLTAYASPADHAAIKQILEQIDVEGDAAAGASVAVYQLEGQPSTTSLIYTLILLRNAFPKVTFSGGAEAGQFVAFATAKDHAGIKVLVDQINAGPPADQKPQVALYTLKSITNTSAAEVLRAAVPKATITVDTANAQRLTASARAADHEAIKTILAVIDVEGDPAVEPSVVVYQLERQTSATAMSYAISLLTQAFPKARLLLGTEVGQFVAWASAKDQEGIQALVDRLNAGPPPEEAPQATVYSLQHITATTALSVLTTAVPKAKLTPDTEDTRRLTAYASPADHAAIKQILEQIDVEGDAGAGATVAVYQLEGQATVSTLYYTLAVFRTAFPRATFSVGADAGQFVAWAEAKDHEGIKALVEQMNAGLPPDQKPQVALYTLKFITATAAAEVLRTAVPKATFTTDPDDPQRLTASARAPDHETIKTVLEEIDVEGEGGGRSTVQVYTLLGKQADTAMTYAFRLLTTAFPRARISLGTEPNQFVAWASPRDHQEIKALVDRLNAAPPPDEAQKAVVYSLKNITATTAMSVLRSAVPRANLTSDTTDPQRLTAYATPAEHATIKEIVAQIDAESDPDASFTVSIYTLEGMSTRAIYYAGVFLGQVVPQAKFTPGSEEGQLVVWATPKDHAQIKTLIEQLQQAPPPELARKITVYTLQNITGDAALAVLRSAVPKAELNADPADPQRINAWASPADHATIADILKQLDVKPDPASAATAAVYQLEGMSQTGAFYALRFLREAVPKANIALGAEGGQIVVWARAQDHEVLKGLVKQLIEESPDALRTAKVYSLQHATASTAVQALTPVVPRASLSLGADPSQLIAFARPLDHAKIAEIIKELDKPVPPETEPTAVVYTLQSGNSVEATRILRTAVPQASISAGAEPHQLIAWARPADHKIIQQIVERLAEKGPEELARKVAVYTLDASSATAAMAFLQTAVPGAQFSVGSDPRRLIAWASAADHEAIKKAVEEMDAGAGQMTSQVYRFLHADPQAAYTVLQALVPSAKMAIDAKEGSLVASGLPEDHEKIKATIEQMDLEDADGQRPALKVHRVTVGSVTNVYRSLALLFRDEATVQLSLDLDNDAVIAVASAAKHERIAELIKSIEDAARPDAESTLELYSLRNVDAASVQEILQQMLDKQGSKADISLDEISNQLVAIARPEVHEQIAKLLEQLRGPEPELEIYDLKYVDPYSAEMAIFRQFDDDALAPEVSTDPVTQQLFIRATAEQQQKIRELLIKMGETGLELLRGRGSQNMRTVPFQGDAKAALEEIRRVWPKLRENEIRVLSPGQPLPPQAPADAPPTQPAPNKSSSRRVPPPFATSFPFQFVSLQAGESPDDKPLDEPAAPPDDPSAKPPTTTAPPEPSPTASDPSSPPAPSPPAAPAPIYVVPSDGSITVVCDDPEALDQFEKLLRAMSGTSGEIGRNISVFNLKHSNAVEIAEKVRELYDTRRSTWRLGTTEVRIVPDERMNRILVQGSRIDRETIEGLVRVLDTEEGTASKPQIIPVRFADATEIAEVVRDVFRSQLSRSAASSSSGTRSSALSRVTPEVAVAPATNSLIVMAPSPLLDEILKLIASLDEAAEDNPARRLKIIALQKTNATRVEDALQRILKSGSPRSPRPSR